MTASNPYESPKQSPETVTEGRVFVLPILFKASRWFLIINFILGVIWFGLGLFGIWLLSYAIPIAHKLPWYHFVVLPLYSIGAFWIANRQRRSLLWSLEIRADAVSICRLSSLSIPLSTITAVGKMDPHTIKIMCGNDRYVIGFDCFPVGSISTFLNAINGLIEIDDSENDLE